LRNSRKIFALLALVMVLAFAGSAYAYCGNRGDGGWGIGGSEDRFYGHGFGGPWLWSSDADIPLEIRNRMDEARGVMDELRAELSKTSVDKDKALTLFRKGRDIRNEISEWFFTQRLERVK
jgi:hypothetical protein